jgi:hypothetical protein
LKQSLSSVSDTLNASLLTQSWYIKKNLSFGISWYECIVRHYLFLYGEFALCM